MPNTARPNILWILSDQHHAEATSARSGGLVQTPHLDALSAQGTTFANAFCQGPLCMPSRASLLYQQYPADHGVLTNAIDGPGRPLPTIVQHIRDAGYHTAALGKMHFFKYPADVGSTLDRMHELGFDEALEMHGKYGNADGRSAYTDFLEQRGELAEYREFLAELNPMSRSVAEAADGRPAHWSTNAAPLSDDGHPDAWLGAVAERWVTEYDDVRPFFAIVGFSGPHDPWDAPDSYAVRYDGTEIPLPATTTLPRESNPKAQALIDYVSDYSDAETLTPDRIREVRRRYFAGVTMVDDQIGRLVGAVAARDDARPTLIVYTSDHGEMLGEHGLFTKSLFYDAATRVPLIVANGREAGGGVYPHLVELTDLTATLLEAAGAEALEDSPGVSLAPALRGDDTPIRSVVRSEFGGYGMWRTATQKVVVHEASGTAVQFFDLSKDPHEVNNLVDDPAWATRIEAMLEEYVRPALATRPA